MNQNQKKYLQKRIDEITMTHMDGITATPIQTPTLTKALEAGKVTLRTPEQIVKAFVGENGRNLRTYNSFNSITIDKVFGGVDAIYAEYQAEQTAQEQKLEDRRAKLTSYAQQLKDGVVFGSDKVALDTIEKFAKMKF